MTLSIKGGLALATVLACGEAGPTGLDLPASKTRVLFIGNSLTYVNDLPGLLIKVAEQTTGKAIATASVAFPDFSLEDHWNEGTAVKALRDHQYDYVVMQQGPSSLPANQRLLADQAAKFAPPIRAAGGEPVLFMVWPASDRQGDFPGVLLSYRNAAARVSGVFAPAGDAWLAAWAEDPNVALYGGDGFHPSALGTYLAAITILGRIQNVDPTTLPDAIPGVSVPAAVVALLQRAAKTALERSPSRPTLDQN